MAQLLTFLSLAPSVTRSYDTGYTQIKGCEFYKTGPNSWGGQYGATDWAKENLEAVVNVNKTWHGLGAYTRLEDAGYTRTEMIKASY